MKTRILALVATLALLLAPLSASADTVRHYSAIAQAVPGGGASTLQMSTVELLRFLVEGTTVACPACTGPGWTLIEAYSNAGRCVPVTPTDVDSMVGCAAMRGDGSALVAGDWFVVESADSTGGGATRHFQMLVEYNATTSWKFVMMPLSTAFWQVGTATPDAAGTEKRVGAGTALITFTTVATGTDLIVVADEDVVIIVRDDAAAPDWIYIGAVDGNLSTSVPPDDRPFVIYDTPANMYMSASNFNRLAPDDATVLVSGIVANYYASFTQMATIPGTYNSAWQLWPALLYFLDASHKHATGTLQHIRQGSDDLGIAGRTIGGKAWACRGTSVDYSPVCWRWDGITVYP